MEEAARIIAKAFSNCITDRYLRRLSYIDTLPLVTLKLMLVQAITTGPVQEMGYLLRCGIDPEVLFSSEYSYHLSWFGNLNPQ